MADLMGRAGAAGPPATVQAWLAWVGGAGGAAAVLSVAAVVAPGLVIDPFFAFIVGFSMVCGSALALAWLVPDPPPRALFGLVLPVAALLCVRPAGLDGVAGAAAVTACLLLAGSLLGAVVGRSVEHVGHLLFVAVVSSLADLASVFQPGGVSHQVVRSEAALSLLALPWPMLGTDRIEPLLGVGDVVFTALYLTACRRHGLAPGRTVGALALGYLATLGLVAAVALALPALPMLGAAVLVAHPAARRPPPADRARGTIAAVAVLIALIVAFRLRGGG